MNVYNEQYVTEYAWTRNYGPVLLTAAWCRGVFLGAEVSISPDSSALVPKCLCLTDTSALVPKCLGSELRGVRTPTIWLVAQKMTVNRITFYESVINNSAVFNSTYLRYADISKCTRNSNKIMKTQQKHT